MKPERNKYLVLNYIFVISLVILFLNDHFFKYQFSNGFTGKLSDMAGIIILPLLLSYIFPKLKSHSIWISALLFSFWKSQYSEGLIDLYNRFALIQITRIVDYSDLLVLFMLPVPYFLIKRINELNLLKIRTVQPFFILFPTTFVLMATSPPPSFQYTHTKGNLSCTKCHITVALTQKEIVEKLKQNNIVFDTIYPMSERTYQRYPEFRKNDIHFYRIDEFVIDKDTLRNVDFAMRSIGEKRTKLYFNGMQTSKKLHTLKLFNKVRNNYKKMVFKELKTALKN